MKYILTVLLLISSLSLYSQNEKLSLNYFINEPTEGKYFSNIIASPGDAIYDWAPKILDSISIAGNHLRKKLAQDSLHPHHRLVYVNKLCLNYSIGIGIESYLVNPDMIVKYADTLLMVYDEYVHTVEDSLNYTSLYSQFERQPFYAYTSKSLAATMVGDYELTDYFLHKARESLKYFDRLKPFKPYFEMIINNTSILSLTARGECSKSYHISEINYNLLKSTPLFGMDPNLSEKDKNTAKENHINNVEGSLYTLLISSNCIMDSLNRVGDLIGIESHLEENKKYYVDYEKIIRERAETDSFYKISYNVHEIFNNYYIINQEYDIALKNIAVFEELEKEGSSHLMIELDRVRIYKNTDPDKALLKIEKLLNDPAIYDYIMVGASTLPTQLYTIKGFIYYNEYLSNGDVEALSKSIQAYENGINKNDVLKNAQSNLEGIQVLEGVIEPLYNQLSECYLLKYKETDELKYLHQSITIGDNSKDFLISQTNSSVLDRGLLKSKYAKLIKKDKYIQGKLYLFQSGLNSGQTNNKNYVDSLVHYKQESKLFLEHIKNNEYGYYKAKYGESIIEIDKVKGGLDTETLILNFMCYEDNTVVHVIGQNTIKVVKLPRKREWVDNIIELNISLREGGLKKYRKNAPIIYSKLFEPLSSSIPENIKHLIIIPDDEINDLVFGALPTKNDLKNLTYLIEDYAISYQYSIRNFLNKKNTNKDIINKNFLGFAIDGNAENEHLTDSKMSCSSSPLNIARETTNLVSKLFVNAEYSVNNKDEAVLKNMDEGAKVIHFAVHGCVGELNNPLNYHLQLSTEEKEENELDMAEIYNANINAQLVVLSACESGLGQLKRGTGLNSIARAFHFAGCPNTIATTAVVDERATSEVILLFYKYLKSGETIDIALQKAKIDYINSNDRDVEPYSWSNIILIGNPIRINFD